MHSRAELRPRQTAAVLPNFYLIPKATNAHKTTRRLCWLPLQASLQIPSRFGDNLISPTALTGKGQRNKGHSSESPGLTSDQTQSKSFNLNSTVQTPFLKQTFPAGHAAVPSLQCVSDMKQLQQMALNQEATQYGKKGNWTLLLMHPS